LRQAYWDKVAASRGLPPANGTFVDMDPLKATRLPIIAKLFPQARIVIMRRDPRDVVWSCFHTNFALTSASYEFTDLRNAALHYDAMMRLTETCLARLPLTSHILRYDRLVSDFDTVTQELCAFIDVPWSPDMRHFDRTAKARGVATASAAQVRKPLYNGTRQWERYRAFMDPVLPILQPWVDRYGFDH
jgi:Sulfotransferase family